MQTVLTEYDSWLWIEKHQSQIS